MPIFSDKKSALLTITGCIVLLGVTLTVFGLLNNTVTASPIIMKVKLFSIHKAEIIILILSMTPAKFILRETKLNSV